MTNNKDEYTLLDNNETTREAVDNAVALLELFAEYVLKRDMSPDFRNAHAEVIQSFLNYICGDGIHMGSSYWRLQSLLKVLNAQAGADGMIHEYENALSAWTENKEQLTKEGEDKE